MPGNYPVTPILPPSQEGQAWEVLMQVISGLFAGRCLTSVAALGVADALGDEPMTTEDLAAATGTHPDALRRMLRLLAARGVFACDDGTSVSHTGASRLLRGDHPRTMRDFTVLLGAPKSHTKQGYSDYTLRTGLPGANRLNPDGTFAIFGDDPEFARVFSAAMTSKAHRQIGAILPVYDFSGCRVVADIGGGVGHLLQAVLDVAPDASGILFDLPAVIGLASAAASPRLALQAGNFLADPLPEADTYLIMDVIHDWPDAEAAALLAAVRKAAPPRARVLVIETPIADAGGPEWPTTLDVVMLLLQGGRQRTLGEHEALLAGAGLRLARVIPTWEPDVSILEAIPALP